MASGQKVLSVILTDVGVERNAMSGGGEGLRASNPIETVRATEAGRDVADGDFSLKLGTKS